MFFGYASASLIAVRYIHICHLTAVSPLHTRSSCAHLGRAYDTPHQLAVVQAQSLRKHMTGHAVEFLFCDYYSYP